MSSRFSLSRSLKTRVTLYTLAIFVFSLWSLSFYSSQMLQDDMQRVLGEQQFATASRIAAEINDNLSDRIAALKLIAKEIDPQLIGNPAALQARLEQRPILSIMFNGGTWVSAQEGIVIASNLPILIGTNYSDRPYLITVLKEGKSAISKPITGKVLKDPIFLTAVPIHDSVGKVIGAIAGTTDLSKTNFLDKSVKGQYGKSGGVLLNAPQYRLIITGTDKTRIMQPLPPPGVNTLLDRYMQGYEGYGVSVNSRGVEELSSAKGIPVAGWFIGVVIPTAEAFAPVYDMQQRMLWATILLTLLAGGLTWWMLRMQLAPMLNTARTLARNATTDQPAQALLVTHQDEIGDMVDGFNHLLKTLGNRETALIESEYRWKFAIEGAGDGLWDWNVPQGTVFFSSRWKEMLGFGQNEIGTGLYEWSKRVHPDDLEHVMAEVQTHLDGLTPIYANEHRVSCKNGSWKWILDRGLVVSRDAVGKPLRVIGTHTDITERKQAQALVDESEARYRAISQSASDAIVTVDSAGKIIGWNQGAETLFGYTQAEALLLALTALMPQSYRSRHLSGFDHLMSGGEPRIAGKVSEFAGLHKDGSEFPIEASLAHWTLAGARFATGIIRDITERKAMEERVESLLAEQKAILNSEISGIVKVKSRKFAWMNSAFAAMLGYTLDELLNQPTRIVYSSDEVYVAFAAAAYPVMSSGQVFRTEIQYQRKDGSLGSYDISGEQLYHGGDESIWSFVDITERKQAEETLRETEKRFRLMADSAPVLIWISGQDKLCNWFNTVWLQFTGRSMEQEMGSGWAEGVHPDDLHRCLDTYGSAFDARQEFSMEYRLKRFDGEYRWLIDTGVPRLDTNGTFVGYIGSCVDITERKLAEVALKNSQEKLRLSETQMAASQQIGGTGSWVYDIATDAIRASAHSLALFGLPTIDRDYRLDEFLACIEQNERVRQVLGSAISEGREYDDEFVMNPADGSPALVIHSIGRAEKGAQGIPLRVLGFIQDVTKRKALEDQVRQLAFFDPLTNLPNRRLLTDRVSQAIVTSKRSGDFGALIYLDLDNFKPLNDKHGHGHGDMVLMEVAVRLLNCVRAVDTVSRIGGDEFVVLLGDLTSDQTQAMEQAAKLAEKIRVALAQPYLLPGGADSETIEHRCSASIGAVLFDKQHQSLEDLLKWADTAMYRSKEEGRNRVTFMVERRAQQRA